MPWIKAESCMGCGICVMECPVDAIHQPHPGEPAVIDEVSCIRCGRCHEVCPKNAVRHDSERIPQEVVANLQWVHGLLEHFENQTEQMAFMDRIVRFFNKQKKVAERTLAALALVQSGPADDMEAAILRLTQESDGKS